MSSIKDFFHQMTHAVFSDWKIENVEKISITNSRGIDSCGYCVKYNCEKCGKTSFATVTDVTLPGYAAAYMVYESKKRNE